MVEQNLEYKIFVSEDSDWYVSARKGKNGPEVLYEGHHRDQAYESILESLGIVIPVEEREMGDLGTYVPTKEDFK